MLSANQEEIIVRDSTDDEADYNEIMQAEREDRKQAMHDFNEEDEISLEGVHEQSFTDEDDDFSLDSLFDDDEEDALGSLFGSDDEGNNKPEFEDEENLDDDGLDSLLDALNGDSDDDDEDDIDDLFGDDDEE